RRNAIVKSIAWHSEQEFSIDGVNFLCVQGDYSQKTNSQRIVILKDRGVLDTYREVFTDMQVRNILEFGIFQGGSPALFSLWFEVDKFVGIDLCSPVSEFDAFRARHPIGRKIFPYYGVSQTD